MSRRMTQQPMTAAAKRDLSLSALSDVIDSMEHDVLSLNTRIGVCRKLMLMVLGSAEPTAGADTEMDPDASYEDFDESQPTTHTGGRNGRRDR